jgi:hypothetical protein
MKQSQFWGLFQGASQPSSLFVSCPLVALSAKCLKLTSNKVNMDIQELKKQEARRARKEAEILLRHASTQLNKTAYEIDRLIEQFNMARIPLKRQAILNEAIKHLAANLMPNLGLAQLAQAQVQLALRDQAPLATELNAAKDST